MDRWHYAQEYMSYVLHQPCSENSGCPVVKDLSVPITPPILHQFERYHKILATLYQELEAIAQELVASEDDKNYSPQAQAVRALVSQPDFRPNKPKINHCPSLDMAYEIQKRTTEIKYNPTTLEYQPVVYIAPDQQSWNCSLELSCAAVSKTPTASCRAADAVYVEVARCLHFILARIRV